MKIPATAPPEIQDAFREVWDAIDRISGLNTNFKGVTLSGVGYPVKSDDAATKEYVDTQLKARA